MKGGTKETMARWKLTGNSAVLRTDCFSCDDVSGHLYFYTTSMTGFCFKCSTWYSRRHLEKELGDLPASSEDLSPIRSLEHAMGILRGKVRDRIPEIELPESTLAWQDKRSRSYLQNRGVPAWLALLHNIRFCKEGEYKDRVLVPVYFKGKLRTFSARDITGKKAIKYLFPSGVSSGSLLFNFDNVQRRLVVVVEGVFDALHLQHYHIPVVASFGKKLTLAQQELLERFERVVFLFDSDAKEETRRYMRTLPQAEAIFLPKEDPTSYGQSEIIHMLRCRLSKLDAEAFLLKRA